MKTNTIAFCLLFAATACSSILEEPVNTECVKNTADEVFYATLEQSGSSNATKVYADENLKVLWNADDRITIYNRYTYGYQYAFQGATGKTAGAFAKVDSDAEFVVGNPLEKIYAVYPHSIDNDINNDGVLSLTWPSPQTYKAESFGIGANVMVSVTDDNQLRFRNVGGYLAIKLYGDNVSVSSITLRGNNGEKLSGRATVTASSETNPTLTFQSASSESLRLECPAPVSIGNSAESATTFWLVVPPTEFTQGFNITVRTSNGLVFYKSTDIAYEIERNTLCRMAAIEVIPSDIVPFADANFKAYCVENFDTDSDGEVSITEAVAVEVINVSTDNIYSLGGIEFFNNIRSLIASGSGSRYQTNDSGFGHGDYYDLPDPEPWSSIAAGNLSRVDLSGMEILESVDISCNNRIKYFSLDNCPSLRSVNCENCNLTEIRVGGNTSLSSLLCAFNQLATLDISNNTKLTGLHCDYNLLSSLDVSNNTLLIDLSCSGNQLSSLDVANNTALAVLNCDRNQLTSLDITNNTVLFSLWCDSNKLTALDASNNTALGRIWCSNNQLASLDLPNDTALTDLICSGNQLTTLDVSNNTALLSLYCVNNQLTALDVSNNTALTELWCYNNPDLTEIWLKTGQTIQNLAYDTSVAQIKYKD